MTDDFHFPTTLQKKILITFSGLICDQLKLTSLFRVVEGEKTQKNKENEHNFFFSLISMLIW